MATTSLKLPDDLKQRAVGAAQKQGMSPHAFMVQAIEQAASAAELRAEFFADALAAKEQMLVSGKGFEAQDVHGYLKARIEGKSVSKPKAKSWRG
jgi:predicted transcriptional regulator